MTPRRRRRLALLALLIVGVGTATALALLAFRENVLFFFSPSDIVAGGAPEGRPFRIGGLVVDGSVRREGDGLTVQFGLTDTAESVTVAYTGILPDLFREGQGIVANGQLDDTGVFVASEVLAKHDETYMPPEVAAALERAGAPHGPMMDGDGGYYGSGSVDYDDYTGYGSNQ